MKRILVVATLMWLCAASATAVEGDYRFRDPQSRDCYIHPPERSTGCPRSEEGADAGSVPKPRPAKRQQTPDEKRALVEARKEGTASYQRLLDSLERIR